eukprot:TRINITY_DN8510_c0_g1_i1.p1 TRINITY_DN8510_c0_g1~~TRINITY_DN8510_c0_g1_i1.p1  ORF type:complete len:562 (+),score=130.30 TRINITY_DN8510_c0_g1_i1:198-1688(+)
MMNNATNGVLLDGYLLLEASGESDPEFSKAGKLVRRNLTRVEVQDLALFVSLTSLDLTDNQLTTLSDFILLPAIKQLSLCCNGITQISPLPTNSFSSLQILDLSHNSIQAETLQYLQNTPLTTLNLTSNDLKILPTSLQLPITLNTLILDHNFLTPQCLTPLSSLPQLKTLGLNYNKLKKWKVSETEENQLSFENLEELGLCNNTFSSWENIRPLFSLPKLAKVYMWENPILSKMPWDSDKIQFCLTANTNTPFPSTAVSVVTTDQNSWKKTRKIEEIPSRAKVQTFNEGVPSSTKKKTVQKESAFPSLANITSFSNSVSHSISNSIVSSPHSVTRENINMTFLTQENEVDIITELNIKELSYIPFIDELNVMKSGFDTVGPLVEGVDSRAAINALQYALDHPLTTHYPDLTKEKGVTRSTENHSIRVKERKKVRVEKEAAPKNSMTFTQRHAAQRESRAIKSAQQKMDTLKQKLHLAETNLNSAITSFSNLEKSV